MAEDTIYRQAALDKFEGVKVNEEYCTEYDIGYNDGIDFAISKLSVLPTAERKGHWIDIPCGTASLWKCSECGDLELEDSYYCPNCGADMRG